MLDLTSILSSDPHTLNRRYALALLALLALLRMNGQSITNGGFESGSTGWSGCIVEIGTNPTYGGSGTNHVAEVDGNFSTSSSDDRVLCQSISGFTIGSVYRVAFDATRRGNNTPPPTVTVTMTIDGGALSRTISRTGGFSLVHEYFYFVATQTTHAFKVTPNFEGSYGMLFDNIAVSYYSGLPIELLYFNASREDGRVDLSWATATEINNDYFTVERSHDGITYAEVLHENGAGDSQEQVAYADVDPAPLSGLSYYRLRQTDLDGTSTVSAVVPVENQASPESGIMLFPNPTGGSTTWLSFTGDTDDGTTVLSIIDAEGKEVFRTTLPMHKEMPAVKLDTLAALGPGVYTVSVQGDARSHIARLMVD